MSGLYIHIPFCRKKCSYCDFHFSTSFESYRNEMIQAIADEISQRSTFLEDRKLKTIYFGGGTPSILSFEELQIIFEKIKSNFDLSKLEEITLEANPEDISEVNINSWMMVGINRLSIGIQSFKESDLQWMNRNHSVQQSELVLNLVKEKFKGEVSIDIMYGLPDLSQEEWKAHIQKVTSFGFNHISAYCLTVEQKTALYHKVKKRELVPSDEQAQIAQFELLVDQLQSEGFEQYEISNFAKNQSYAVHNSSYWKGLHYLGIGPSAHSFDGKRRLWNVANNSLYLKAVQSKRLAIEEEVLSPKNRFNELLLTGLRTKWGVSLEDLKAIHDFDSAFQKQLSKYLKLEELHEKEGRIFLTESGKLRADYICANLFLVD